MNETQKKMNSLVLGLQKKPQLKRLPIWGNPDLDEINFEWPTQEMLDAMQPDVYLQSIEF